MNAGRKINLGRARRALQRLDRLAEEHPELVAPHQDREQAAREWELALQEIEEMETKQYAFRLDDELVARLDLAAEALKKEFAGVPWTRTTVLRFLLTDALDRRGIGAPKARGTSRKKKRR